MATVATATVAMVAMVAMVVMAATKKTRHELRAVHTATATWFMAAKYPCTQPPIEHANPNESRAMHTDDKHQSTSHDTQHVLAPRATQGSATSGTDTPRQRLSDRTDTQCPADTQCPTRN